MNPNQPIQNAKNVLLSQKPGTVPNVSGGIQNYFKPLIFKRVTKKTVAAQLVETTEQINTVGFLTPAKRNLAMKPEGQRKWQPWTLYADPTLKLDVDDIITLVNLYQGNMSFRVMGNSDYSEMGYMQYDLIQDYSMGEE